MWVRSFKVTLRLKHRDFRGSIATALRIRTCRFSTMVAWSAILGEDDETAALLDGIFSDDDERRAAACVKARRIAAAAGVAEDARGGQGPSGRKRKLTPFCWEDHLLRLNETDFKRRYRLDFDSFMKLLRVISKDLDVDDECRAACGRQGELVRNEVKLAIALRYLAGGDPKDLWMIYGVSYSYVYQCVWAVIDAINLRIKIQFPIDDPEKLATLEAEFRSTSRGGVWRGQVAALDGVHFAMQAPTNQVRRHGIPDVGRACPSPLAGPWCALLPSRREGTGGVALSC